MKPFFTFHVRLSRIVAHFYQNRVLSEWLTNIELYKRFFYELWIIVNFFARQPGELDRVHAIEATHSLEEVAFCSSPTISGEHIICIRYF